MLRPGALRAVYDGSEIILIEFEDTINHIWRKRRHGGKKETVGGRAKGSATIATLI
jgi:hypothetical protein